MFRTWVLIVVVFNQVLINQVTCENAQDDNISTTPWRKKFGAIQQGGLASRQAENEPLFPQGNQVRPIVPPGTPHSSGLRHPTTQPAYFGFPAILTSQQQSTDTFHQGQASNVFPQWPNQFSQTFNPGKTKVESKHGAAFHGNPGDAFPYSFTPNIFLYQRPFQPERLNGAKIQFNYPQFGIGPIKGPISPIMIPLEYSPTPFTPPHIYPLADQFGYLGENNVAGTNPSTDAEIANAQSIGPVADVALEGIHSGGINAIGTLAVEVANNLASDGTVTEPNTSEASFTEKLTQPVLGMTSEVRDSSTTVINAGSIASSIKQGIETASIDQVNSLLSASKLTNAGLSAHTGITQLQNSGLNDYQAPRSPDAAGAASNFESSNHGSLLLTTNQNAGLLQGGADNLSGTTQVQSFATGGSSSVTSLNSGSIGAAAVDLAMDTGSAILNGAFRYGATVGGNYAVNYSADEGKVPLLVSSPGSLETGEQGTMNLESSIVQGALGSTMGSDAFLGGHAYSFQANSGLVGDNKGPALDSGGIPILNEVSINDGNEGGHVATSFGGGSQTMSFGISSGSEGTVNEGDGMQGIESPIFDVASSSNAGNGGSVSQSSYSSSSLYSAVQSSSSSSFSSDSAMAVASGVTSPNF